MTEGACLHPGPQHGGRQNGVAGFRPGLEAAATVRAGLAQALGG